VFLISQPLDLSALIKTFKLTFLFLFIVFLFPLCINAQVVINEVYPNSEWVELYKTQSGEVSLDGCILYFHNPDANIQKKTFSADDKFLENEFFKKVDSGGSYINDDSDTISLKCLWGEDRIGYGDQGTINSPKDNQSIGRNPDGIGNFYILDNPTAGSANSSPVTPTPTASPTQTPSPTPSSTPTSTPTPTKTPSPTPTPAKKSPTPTPQVVDDNSKNTDETILGLREELKTPTPIPEGEKQSRRNVPIIAAVFILAGAGFMIAAFYPFIKKHWDGYNSRRAQKKNIPHIG